ncbi:MAG: methyltransferase domain-containing protein [Candidatus Aegiribacteria sp.]|nr:methyltransferase domain-containing protein [Candidatus Aegiribacteria sp.]
MQKYLVKILECPKCHGKLDWNITEQSHDRIEVAEARCQDCSSTYPIRDGIAVFLTMDLKRNDLWEQVDNRLDQLLKQYPEMEKRLMDVPLDTLGPVDQWYRGDVHKNRGDVEAADAAYSISYKGLHSAETVRCTENQMDYVINEVSQSKSPIVDLASGSCGLVRRMLKALPNSIVVTDFSPTVLVKNRKWLKKQGLYDRVSLLAFDARQTPFATDSISMLTTLLGLNNIQNPGNLLEELYRIVNGKLLSVSQFYPEDDKENGTLIEEGGLTESCYRNKLIEHFHNAGWAVEVKNSSNIKTIPAPPGVVLEGARVDGLPVQSTYLEWCVLLGTNA